MCLNLFFVSLNNLSSDKVLSWFYVNLLWFSFIKPRSYSRDFELIIWHKMYRENFLELKVNLTRLYSALMWLLMLDCWYTFVDQQLSELVNDQQELNWSIVIWNLVLDWNVHLLKPRIDNLAMSRKRQDHIWIKVTNTC